MKRIPLDIDYIVEEYLAGKSEYALANELGVSRNVIRTRLLEADIEPRSHSEAGLVRAAQMTPAERMAQAAAAHEAATGRPKTFEEQCLAALTRQHNRVGISRNERRLAKMLSRRNIIVVPQEAIGPYNCDLGAYPIAVEVYGGNWHWHGHHLERVPERFRYILNAGWHILVVADTQSFPLTEDTADYVAAYIQAARSDPTLRREYRVVWGAGEFTTSGSLDDDEISIEPPFTTTRDSLGRYKRVPKETS